MKIEEMNFTTRVYNCLKRKHIDTVEQIFAMSDEDLLSIRSFGHKCLTEVYRKTGRKSEQDRPIIPGPTASDYNIMELCFRNGEKEMKEKVLSLLMEHRTSPGGFCHEHIVYLIKQVGSL